MVTQRTVSVLQSAVALGLLSSLLGQPGTAAGSPPAAQSPQLVPSGEYYDWTKTRQPERPWLLPYDQTVVMKLFLAAKRDDGHRGPDGSVEKCNVFLNFEQALEVIKRLDNITCGIPKIVYLVGWQYDGHDSKYPAWAEVNRRLKRPQDRSAVESLRWLMREGRKYHTAVSLHINMFDAYPDSPLWDTYVKLDIIAKDRDGKVLMGPLVEEVPGMSRISYTQEWKLGLAQKRIDGLIAMLPELKDAKTIHIDAFHSCRPMAPKEPISPLLGYTMAQEAATQRKIYRYWRTKGLDVTSEGSAFMRPDAFVGLQPMSWWDNPTDLPPELYCGSPMHVEQECLSDAQNLPGLIDQFCLCAVPWYYRNYSLRHKTDAIDDKQMREPGGPLKPQPRQGLFLPHLAEYDNNVCIPAMWCKEKTLVAYSREGYDHKTWPLPPGWEAVTKVIVSEITLAGLKRLGDLDVHNGAIELTLKPRQGVIITP